MSVPGVDDSGSAPDVQANDSAAGSAEAQPQAEQAAAEQPQSTLLTGEEEGEGAASGEPKEGEAAPAVEGVPETPEGYSFNFGDGVQVDTGLLSGFRQQAHALGLTQAQAEGLATMYAEHAQGGAQKAQEAQHAALTQARTQWEGEIKARPQFQAEIGEARRSLKEFGSPELTEVLNQTMLGSHPVFFDFMVKVGKALGEPTARGQGMGGVADKPLEERLWKDSK